MVGRQHWYRVNSEDAFYYSTKEYQQSVLDNKSYATVTPVPYWKLTQTCVEMILFFCCITKKNINYQQQPFANREQLVSSLDSYFQFNFIYIFNYYNKYH